MGATTADVVTPTDTMTRCAPEEAARIAALRAGDERAFGRLVDELSPRMLKMARVYLGSDPAAEDAVQEAWLVVLRGLDRFEGRSALATWVLGIVINTARARRARDARSRPFSSLESDDTPAVGRERFLPADHARWPGHWAIAPTPWPERALETADETCNALGLTDTNQRVLLHRARTKLRAALEAAFDATENLT